MPYISSNPYPLPPYYFGGTFYPWLFCHLLTHCHSHAIIELFLPITLFQDLIK